MGRRLLGGMAASQTSPNHHPTVTQPPPNHFSTAPLPSKPVGSRWSAHVGGDGRLAHTTYPPSNHLITANRPPPNWTPPQTVGRRWGAFFGGDGRLFACQIIAILVTVAWVTLILGPYFYLMSRLNIIRVPIEQELAGLDASKYSVLTTNELPRMPAPKQKTYV